MISRTGEVVLGIIGAVFNVIAIILVSLLVINGSTALQDEEFSTIMEQEMLNDPQLTAEEAEQALGFVEVFVDLFGVIGWAAVVAFVISLIFNILGIVFVSKNKKPKLAGIMFILGGIFAGIISLTSIILYVAAIMCFVRKSPVKFEDEYTTEQTY
ncbi:MULTISPECIES: DUF4064 domain-containing protein [unclassified Psychrobacillus]|uniref:DUF4064 domain-containing protein n=1 Tax=unclassified Psychrobacillus TaxID=2636677 RepID=UPI00197FF86F|nr:MULTISPECIES: DUF4064 domain-containing protein [unclassified Psychrobacillus]MCM3357602.1 DUF4064 domain-containing protein [Psychrobacillus sp. MER TA 171]